MVSLILIILAAICNAAMDKTTHHYHTSIFRNLDRKFYDPNLSWKYAYRIGGYKFDFWHITKSLMIMLIVAAIIHYEPISANWFTTMTPFALQLMDWCIIGTGWNLTFNLFYNNLLSAKK